MAFFLFLMKEGERSLDVFKIMGKLVLSGKEQFEEDVNDAKKIGTNLASSIGKALQTAAKVGAVAIGACATAIGAVAKASFDSFAEYEQLVGGAQLLFGDAYGYIAEQAQNAYKEVQMSQNDYLQQVNGFATGLKTALGGNEQAAAELAHRIIKAEADVVAATGNSQEAVQNAFNGIMKSNFTMLDNLQLGITPTKEGFQTLIDQVNEYNKTLGKTTNYQIDNLADCQSALIDYIEMQGLSGYAANEAADTIQGSISMVKASWQNLLTGFADSSQDLDVLIENLVGSVTVAAQNIVPRLALILGGISTALEQIMPVISAELPAILEQLLPGVISGAVSLVNGLIMALPTILQILIDELPSVISQLAEGVIECFPVLQETIETLFSQMWDAVTEIEALQPIIDWFAEIGEYIAIEFAPILEDLSGAIQTVKDAVQPLIDKLKDYITSGEAAEDATNLLKDAVAFVADAYETAKGFVEDCVTAFQDACTWVDNHKVGLELLASAIGVVTTALGAYKIAQAIANAGGVAGIATNAATTVGYYALTAAEAVATAGASAFGAVMAFVTSPITLVVAAIAAVIAIIVLCVKHWDEIKAKVLEVATMISEKWEEIKSAIAEKVASMVATVTTKFNEIKSAIASKVSDVYNKVKETFENIKTTISTKVSDVYNKVKETFENIKESIQNAITAAKEKVAEIWQDIKDVFSDALDIGKKLIDDIKEGINNAWEGLKKWFKNLWDGLFGNLTVDVTANGSGGTDGSHANGLDYVPFDGYIAELHKGEMVVPAAEARVLRSGASGAVANSELANILLMILDAVQEGNSRETVFKLNNREFGRAVRGAVNA